MKKKVLEAIEKYSLVGGGDSVSVALSGGADSMALLYALLELAPQLGIRVNALHFNHKIRGEEALRDECFVREQCERLGVELIVGSADVPLFARQSKLSLELAARQLRYDFLQSNAKGLIATAHTASDNAETVLFNIARGTALSGLCGIPKRRGNIIRPLILCSRGEVEAYCAENDIPFVTDSTNLCDAYSRNQIRHNAVPCLLKINPSFTRAVSRMTDAVAECNDFLQGEASAEYERRYSEGGLSLCDFGRLHPALAKGVLVRFLKQNGVLEPEARLIDELFSLCNSSLDRVNLPRARYAEVKGGRLSVTDGTAADRTEYQVSLSEEPYVFTQGKSKIHNLFLNNTLDCDKIVGQLVLRSRLSGDSIRLYRRGCTKSLKKLFCEEKIPACKRDSLPVLADACGVVWIYGIGVAERCAVCESTRRIYKIKTTLKGEEKDDRQK